MSSFGRGRWPFLQMLASQANERKMGSYINSELTQLEMWKNKYVTQKG